MAWWHWLIIGALILAVVGLVVSSLLPTAKSDGDGNARSWLDIGLGAALMLVIL